MPTVKITSDRGWRGRLGVIIPANNTVLEPEVYRRLPEGITAHFSRIPTESMAPAAYAEMLKHVDRAVDELACALADVYLYACLSTSLTQPEGWDESFAGDHAERLERPFVTASQAVVGYLNAQRFADVAIVSPYPPHLDRLVPGYLSRRGITVRQSATLNIDDIREVGNLDPVQVYRLAKKTRSDGIDALVVLATDLPTIDIVEALEADVGVPVVTTNQALTWAGVKLLNRRGKHGLETL